MKMNHHFTCYYLYNKITALPILIFLLLASINSYSQSNTAIEGKIDQMQPGKFIFYKWTDVERMSPDFQSVPTAAKGFKINLDIPEGKGGELILFIGKTLQTSKTALFIYVDKGSIVIHSTDSLFNNVSFSGSAYAQDMDQYHKLLRSTPALAKFDQLKTEAFEARKAKDTSGLSQKTKYLDQLDATRKKLALQWINEHPNSPISVFVIHSAFEPLAGKLSADEQRALLLKLTPAAKNNVIAADMLYKLDIDKVVNVGKKAPEFTQNDTLGNPVSLKDFKGKYVLLDFWASWCAPCRAENPAVVKAYNEYKDKGFTVLSVSLDQPGKKDAWLKAIHTDHLTWTHVSDLKFWGNAVARLYDINAVPSNFLIGPDGTVIAKNLHGEELELELAKILK